MSEILKGIITKIEDKTGLIVTDETAKRARHNQDVFLAADHMLEGVIIKELASSYTCFSEISFLLGQSQEDPHPDQQVVFESPKNISDLL